MCRPRLPAPGHNTPNRDMTQPGTGIPVCCSATPSCTQFSGTLAWFTTLGSVREYLHLHERGKTTAKIEVEAISTGCGHPSCQRVVHVCVLKVTQRIVSENVQTPGVRVWPHLVMVLQCPVVCNKILISYSGQ